MKFRFYLLFISFTLLFLFYPGNSHYYEIFAYNRDLFNQEKKTIRLSLLPIPYTTSSYSPEITASGAYIVDLPSFTPLYELNSQSRFFPASTTKIITALVAIELYKPEDIVAIKQIVNEGQTMGLVRGEKITVENLLYGILVHSGNDAAYAIADNYGREKFVKKMNDKALSLHMKNSNFTTPAGLDDGNPYTTPFDLALAARELLRNPYLKKIVSTKEIIISDIDFIYFHKLTNVNKLLGEIQGIGGLKTGYTENAGENLISFYKKNGNEFLIVLLKSEDRFNDTRTIVEWINQNVRYEKIKDIIISS